MRWIGMSDFRKLASVGMYVMNVYICPLAFGSSSVVIGRDAVGRRMRREYKYRNGGVVSSEG